MTQFARTLGVTAVVALVAIPVLAQTPKTASQQTPSETRPATTTINGDTGLWFVPTAEILPDRKWSASAYRVNFDYDQGFTDVSNWPITFGYGLRDKVEIFGAMTVVNRIDRDVRPLFIANGTQYGGFVNDYPFVSEGWTGNNFGDIWLGGKYNIRSQHTGPSVPAAFALRGMVKLPTGSTDHGAGTGRADFVFDGIVSKEINSRVELSGYGGFIFRGDPDEFDLSNGFRWGFGAGVPTRKHLRLTAELHGEAYLSNTVTLTGLAPQPLDSSVPPIESDLKSPVNASAGLTWFSSRGFFAGAGINWNLHMSGRSDFGTFGDRSGDSLGFQARLGYHPGVKVYVAPAPPPPPPPPPVAPTAAANRPPTVRARCEPCTVEVGKLSTVTADAMDPDGDALTYRWSAPTGRLSNPADRQTPWTAPMVEGPVQVTVTVTDTKGATASDTVTIQVIKPAVREFTFEDVHFDFDRYSLRPEATRALDEAIRTLQENPQLRIEIEGHTCNIGTAEYNLALGERRATAVRDYLTSRGITADRLRTVSYGEERPKYDNAREETRRLNRRAAMIVRVQ
jgi:outer membrane protein OmpA-like peptidoglycan-associated protein